LESEKFADQDWFDKLQNSGYRLTGPRRALVEIMANSDCALSAMDLFDLGRQKIPGLGLVTVYRILEKLEEIELVQRVHQQEDCHRYLRASRGHEHLLLCTVCGRAVFFTGDDVAPLIQSLSERTGFQIREHWLQLFGLCSQCQSQ
jgi:Fur family transcriptional regulator, ferric uptake regulator